MHTNYLFNISLIICDMYIGNQVLANYNYGRAYVVGYKKLLK